MKNHLLIVLFALSSSVEAQIIYEHTYDTAATFALGPNSDNSQLMVVKFEVSGERYVKINRWGQVMDVYNMNHSLVKTISLASVPLCFGSLGDILYLSEKLFDTDPAIEFMYIRAACGASSPYYITNIYKEDGTILFSDTGAAEIRLNFEQQQWPIYNTSVGTKMILSYRNGQAKVFGLPGTLSTAIQESTGKLIQAQGISNPYPNPTNNTTRVDYKLPDGINQGEIVFYDLQGKEIKRFKVDRTFDSLLISTADIPAGTYFYQLQTANQASEGKKMVVVK